MEPEAVHVDNTGALATSYTTCRSLTHALCQQGAARRDGAWQEYEYVFWQHCLDEVPRNTGCTRSIRGHKPPCSRWARNPDLSWTGQPATHNEPGRGLAHLLCQSSARVAPDSDQVRFSPSFPRIIGARPLMTRQTVAKCSRKRCLGVTVVISSRWLCDDVNLAQSAGMGHTYTSIVRTVLYVQSCMYSLVCTVLYVQSCMYSLVCTVTRASP